MDMSTVLINTAYAVYVGSTFFRDIFRLRLMLVVASVVFLFWGIVDDNLSVILWNFAFGSVSAFQLLRLVHIRRSVKLTELESTIRAERFASMSERDFLLFGEMGARGSATDSVLIEHGESHGRLLLVTAGEVEVQRLNRVATSGAGDSLGEMSLLSDLPAAATVTAKGLVDYREWTHERIAGSARAEPSLSAAFRAALAADLSRKLADADR
jgi:CRP-like cAMP-binding protein